MAPHITALVDRKLIYNSSQKLFWGCSYFWNVFPKGFSKHNIRKSVYLLTHYGDWIFKYACLVIKCRILS